MAATGYGGPSAGALDFQDRQARQAREIERPIICPECNSSWFSEVAFNQYSDIAMGSGTGGDIRQINMMPQTLRVCVCGHPYSPNLTGIRGRAATESLASFQESLKGAQAVRKVILAAGKSTPPSMTELAKSFAGATELKKLRDDLDELLVRSSSLIASGEVILTDEQVAAEEALVEAEAAARGITATVVDAQKGTIQVTAPRSEFEKVPGFAEAEAAGLIRTGTGAPASVKVVPPAPVAEPHPNSKEGKALKAARLAVDQANREAAAAGKA
jgi:hypothetical protein